MEILRSMQGQHAHKLQRNAQLQQVAVIQHQIGLVVYLSLPERGRDQGQVVHVRHSNGTDFCRCFAVDTRKQIANSLPGHRSRFAQAGVPVNLRGTRNTFF
ncbi:hypothetical protein SDC9_89316 [bioreactor metagenome]|uniref:Uncharacterized protein n=1 Tax=bioreactor metagenome TaxID=1076179 RepID=A0A644ZNW7_9ZZZZ